MARKRLAREKRRKGKHTAPDMRKALELIQNGCSIRKAAKDCDLPYPTLRRYALKFKNDPNCSLTSIYETRVIFTPDQEHSLKEYIIDCSLKFYGLSAKEVRRIAYQMGKLNNIPIPSAWETNKMAGKEWFRSFRQRNPELVIKKPEPCSLARATAFNKENVKRFFENLKDVLLRHENFANGTRIYNLDETATTTVQRPQKVVSLKGKSICKVTSGERGTLVTTCLIINAQGQAVPPVMVFPRKTFKTHMLNGAPVGTLGLATTTGWMNSDLFVEVMKHFIKHTASSLTNPALLILDNHESHLSIEALDLAKNAGVTVLTLHPHTTAKLQPLDVGINAPFKTFYNSAMDSWLMRHPGESVSIYQVAECVGQAFLKALTPLNIVNAFKKCGIHPFDESIFTEEDFLPSDVTDRTTLPDVSNDNRDSPSLLDISITPAVNHNTDPQPSYSGNTSRSIVNESDSKTAANKNSHHGPSPKFISPMDFRAPLKAQPRKGNRKRKAGRSMIPTDTPEKLALSERRAKNIKKEKSVKKDLFDKTKKGNKEITKDKKPDTDTSSDEENFEASGSSSGGEEFISDSEGEDKVVLTDTSKLTRPPTEGDYVVVLFVTKKSKAYFVGKILEKIDEDTNDFYISFLKLKSKVHQTFAEPTEPDLAGVKIDDIKYILPEPKIQGTSRRQSTYKFNVDLGLLNFPY